MSSLVFLVTRIVDALKWGGATHLLALIMLQIAVSNHALGEGDNKL